MRFDLLGYLLNSLDDAERRRVEAHLRVDPALRAQLEELRRLIEPIDAELDALQAIDGVDLPPPSDLVARTMALIPGAPSEPSQPSVWRNRPERELAGGPRRTLADAVILLASALAMVSLALPLTLQARHAAQREQCATNIADFGEALLTVSHHDPNGRLPIIPADGPESFAGIVWVRLAEGFLPEVDQKRWCPSAGRPAGSLPFEELVHFANAMPEGLFALRRDAGGSYSTYLGVREDGRRVSAPRWQGRTWYALLSDEPLGYRKGGRAPHDGMGINVLFEDGHVQFLPLDQLFDSRLNPFLNHEGRVESGVNADDASLGPSWMSPVYQFGR
jgi:prepilin-type processing-associated H-X9-DG protein